MHIGSRIAALALVVGTALLAAPAGAQLTYNQVADTTTLVPGGAMGEVFAFFVPPALDGGQVAFLGFGSGGQQGIYRDGVGTLGVIADLNTAIPGGTGNFTEFAPPALDGGQVAFLGSGSGGQSGIYRDGVGTLGVIADTNTAIPGGTGNFTSFGLAALDGDQVAFAGFGDMGQGGIYRDGVGTLGAIADTNTAIPGGTGNFTAFDDPSLDGGLVAFAGVGSGGQEGIYLERGGALEKVIAVGDMIDTRLVTGLNIGPNALSGDQVTFRADFEDESSGIFVADLKPVSPSM